MLNADYTRIENFKQVCYRVDEDGKTQYTAETVVITMAMMNLGFSDITHKNKNEVYERLRILELVFGAFMTDENGDVPMTKEAIFRHVGLRVNVTPKSKSAFKTDVYKWLRQRVRDEDRKKVDAVAA